MRDTFLSLKEISFPSIFNNHEKVLSRFIIAVSTDSVYYSFRTFELESNRFGKLRVQYKMRLLDFAQHTLSYAQINDVFAYKA